MKFFFMNKLLRFFGKKFDGKKTYAGAAGKILTGIATLCGGVVGLIGIAYPDLGLPPMEIETAWGAILGGLAVVSSGIQGIGLGHKTEKLRNEMAQGR